jgi:hypothetical protein
MDSACIATPVTLERAAKGCDRVSSGQPQTASLRNHAGSVSAQNLMQLARNEPCFIID